MCFISQHLNETVRGITAVCLIFHISQLTINFGNINMKPELSKHQLYDLKVTHTLQMSIFMRLNNLPSTAEADVPGEKVTGVSVIKHGT